MFKLNVTWFIKFWNQYFKLKDSDLEIVLHLLENNGSPEFLTNFQKTIFWGIRTSTNYSCLHEHQHQLNRLHEVVQDYVLNYNSSKKKYLLQHFNSLPCSPSTYLSVMLTLTLLDGFTTTPKVNWYNLSLTEIETVDAKNLFTLTEFIYEGVDYFTNHSILLLYHKLIDKPIDEVVFVDCYHELIRVLHYLYPNEFLICILKQYKDVSLNVNSFSSDMNFSFSAQPTNSPKEITVICLCMILPLNTYKRYNVLPTPPQLLYNDDIQLLCNPFQLHLTTLFIQKNSKTQSKPTIQFFESISALTTTALHCDTNLFEIAIDLIEIELNDIGFELSNLVKIITDEDFTEIGDAQLDAFIKKFYLREKLLTSKLSIFMQNKNRFFNEKQHVKEYLLTSPSSTTPLNEKLEMMDALYSDVQQFLRIWSNCKKQHKTVINLIKQLQNLLSRYHNIKLFFNYKSFIFTHKLTKLYFFVHSDFRGRLYYKSHTSPQTIWYFRFLYHFGYNDDYHLNKNKFLLHSSVLTPEEFDKIRFNFCNFDSNYLSILQSIGFLFKNALQQSNILLKEIIFWGLDIYLINVDLPINEYCVLNLKPSLKEKMELAYYIRIIKKLEQKEYFKFYLCKDSTCSVTQHAGKLLGYRPETLNYLNLANDNTYYDTYYVYISQLHSYLINKDSTVWSEDRLKMLNRSTLKNLIMTCEYGISFYSAWQEYLSLWDTLPEFEKLFFCDKKNFSVIYQFFTSNIIDKYLFHKTKSTWIEEILASQLKSIKVDDLEMLIHYFHPTYKTVYFSLPKKFTPPNKPRIRHSFYWKQSNPSHHTNTVDLRKTKMSVYVNSIHFLDAFYLRNIVRCCQDKNISIVTIHDAFLVSYDCGYLLLSIADYCFLLSNNYEFPFYQHKALTIASSTIIV